MRRTLALLALCCLVLVPSVAAATPISGTVTVEGGSADGARVTVTPVGQDSLQRVGEPATTQVNGSSFSVEVPDAPRYVVQVAHGGATHHVVLQNRTSVDLTLSRTVSGRVVDEDGTPRANATVDLIDDRGLSVAVARTGSNGTFEFGPLQPDATYQVRTTADGAPYRQTVNTTANRSVTVRTLPPTSNESVLAVPEGTRTAHVVQLVAPQNGSTRPSAVEAITLRNTADRPFVGSVSVRVPPGGSPYAAMVDGRRAEYAQTDDGVVLNVTVPANGTTQVGVAYDLSGQRFEKRLARDTPSVAVVLRGYDPGRVGHSENLRVGDAPVPLLTNAEPLQAGDTVSVNLTGARTGGASGGNASGDLGSAENNSIPRFPALPVVGSVVGMVVVGLLAYRLRPPGE